MSKNVEASLNELLLINSCLVYGLIFQTYTLWLAIEHTNILIKEKIGDYETNKSNMAQDATSFMGSRFNNWALGCERQH